MPQKECYSPLGNYKKELPLNVLWSLSSTAYVLAVAERKCRSIKVILWPKASAPQQPKMGSPEGRGAESVERKAGTSSKDDPLQDDNWASRAAPATPVEQAELLPTDSNAGFGSVECFSVTFPKGLEGTSTIDTHPFQTVCSNTPLTITTSAIPSHQQNCLSWRGWLSAFPKDGVRRKQRSKAEARDVFHRERGQTTANYLDGMQHSSPERLHANKKDGKGSSQNKYVL